MAYSASPFDGTYEGCAGKACSLPPTNVTVTVVDSVVTGKSAWANGSVAIRGSNASSQGCKRLLQLERKG